MMLPKYYYLKALGGSSANSPRETLSSLMQSLPQSSRGLEHKLPRETLSSPMRSLPQSTRGLEHKLPPRDAIIAHAIFTSKHSGAQAQTPPERRYHRPCDLYLKALGGSSTNSTRETLSSPMRYLPQSTRGLERKLPPRDAIIAHAIFTSKHSGAQAQTPPERRYHRPCDIYLKALGGSSANSP